MEIITENESLAVSGFYWRARDHVRALICQSLEQDGFANAFSTRTGGTSPMPHDALNLAGFDDDTAENILENRRRFLRLFEDEWTLATCWQVHGAEARIIRDVQSAYSDATEQCDALVTDAPGVLLGVKTADCVPVILGDRRTGAAAAVHAGWRGTLATIVPRTLQRMHDEFGTQAEDIRVGIGPAAGVCCYEVGLEVIDAFQERFPKADELFVHTRPGHARINLQRANRNQLIEAGVSAERIHTAPLCTMCRTDLFFSYRREKNAGRISIGRLLACIGHSNRD
ncbi:MAG: peptidoglycan editing factor PgeF [Pyrinomonadaceae bacterium]|nr:peptidoglycan editing factor PgeF [Pyrinomonadaceae bacterium]